MKKKKLKWILGIIGLIALGALGSGLWQIGIEPVGSWLLETIFKITTLGLSSLSDAFYQRVAAKGLHEETSLQVLVLVTFIIIVYITCEFGKKLGERRRKHDDEELQEIKDLIEQYKSSIAHGSQDLIQKAIDKYNM